MSTTHRNSKFAAVALTLSIAALPNLVNGQAQSLSTVNSDKSSNKLELKDSIKDAQTGITQLITAVLKNGNSATIGGNLAPVIGLPKAMPTKDIEIVVRERDQDVEKRNCIIVYEKPESVPSEASDMRAVCAYIVKFRRFGLDRETRYFRVDLHGKLEKAVLSQSKADTSGKVVRGSGVKTDLDINSPEVKKTFEAEMKFWLKDWLRKQQKAPAKKV